MSLAKFLQPGKTQLTLQFPSENLSLDYCEAWQTGGAAIRNLSRRIEGRPFAIVLANASACVELVIGAIANGASMLSVPMPPRAASLAWYRDFIGRLCATSGVNALLLSRSLKKRIESIDGVELIAFDEPSDWGAGGESVNDEQFRLIQFTSGSTAEPKGIVLDDGNIEANLRALVDWLKPQSEDVICSWLPLSHDMGLMGMLLGGLAGAASIDGGQFCVVLQPPTTFMLRPSMWMRMCDHYRGTITAAPNFAYALASRCAEPSLNLALLRACIVGAEPIAVDTLRDFEDAFSSNGFRGEALCPAFGMAESVVGVTGVSIDAHWRSETMGARLVASELGFESEANARIVSCGKPLMGNEVRIECGEIGEILVRGTALAECYSDGEAVQGSGGWFSTGDIGFISDGDLFVLGREDDVFQAAGRNVHASDIETTAGSMEGVYARRVITITNGDGFSIVAECETQHMTEAGVSALARRLHSFATARLDVAPRSVLVTRPGTLPLTASGKIQRRKLADQLRTAQIDMLPGSI